MTTAPLYPEARHAPRPAIYWTDLLLCAAVAWSGIVVAGVAHGWASWLGMLFGSLALYRGIVFVHELSHQPPSLLPGFNLAWHLLFGWPCGLPAVVYIGMHRDHHAPSRYGGEQDPEYLPLAGKPWAIAGSVLIGALLPLALVLRFALLTPASWAVPGLRRWLEVRASSLVLNTAYRRTLSVGERAALRRSEGAILLCWIVAGCAIAAFPGFAGPALALVLALAVAAFLNGLRVLAAHAYRAPERPVNATAQAGDAVDIPGAWWTALWAPVGLRFHALHHLRPGVPYHALAELHREQSRQVPYPGRRESGLWTAIAKLARDRADGQRPARPCGPPPRGAALEERNPLGQTAAP
jgi:fatty acid desaturase